MKKPSIFLFLEEQCQLTAMHLSTQDNALLSYIDSVAPLAETERHQFFKEFLNGAYIFIDDGGASYAAFQQIEQKNLVNRDRSSSHESIDTQYAFRSSILGECLFGTREVDSEKGSWIQLEAYHTNYMQMPAHLMTYAWYVITGENSGPMGTSIFTEAKPFVLIPPTPQAHLVNSEGTEPLQLAELFSDLDNDLLDLNNLDPSVTLAPTEQMVTEVSCSLPLLQPALAVEVMG